MKKEFTEDQLVYIRDIFAELLQERIDLGHRDTAQEALDIINVVQSKMNCDEYDSLETWVLDDSESYGYIELAEPSDYEIAAIDKMKEFTKSSETEPSDMLRDSVNVYLEECCANHGQKPIDFFKRRKIAINRLIILCISSCTNDELKKLDDIVNLLAEDRRR